MEKTYNPHAIEKTWYERWEKAGDFKPSGTGKSYCIVLPPPNVTGSLHMGHGFQHTLMDTLIRYHRMLGENTLWQSGIDHAGIATQLVVERQLELEGKTRHDLGREEFIKKTWEWKNTSGGMISKQMRRMGSSIDWSRDRFTMDDHFSNAVNIAFKKLYDDKLIYKGKRLVNWDVKLQSAISDLEVNTVEEAGSLWHIKYYLNNSDKKSYLVVATTRPETLFGDVAVAVHPDDERYKQYIGQMVSLPLTDKKIPVIADEYVEKDFGSGVVKITPGHDFNDYEVGKRHNLEIINILNKNGTLNNLTPYENIDRAEARKLTVAALEKLDLILKTEKYTVKTPRSERTNEIVEPFLTDQWYVKMSDLAKPAIEAVKTGKLKFIPENWTKTYLQWLENIQDWCISRQLWWGHRIPIEGETDVLDTWFSAALWPFATLGWPDKTPELKTFFPTQVLVTGFDIIFFWVARMVMFSLYFTGEVPFSEVYITGLIRDQYGQKMSKSKGNVLDPIDLIDGIDLEGLIKKRTYGLLNPKQAQEITKHTQKEFPDGIPAFGTDALRFTYCALANTGRDIKFDLGRVAGYRNFCNKLWNAARFVGMNTELSDDISLADQWILSKLQKTIQNMHQHFSDYRFDLLAQTIYEFVWNDYCDWYLELSKINKSKTIRVVLIEILKLLNPLMPFITAEIYQLFAEGNLQHEKYPEVNSKLISESAEAKINWLQTIIMAIRNIRSEMQIPPSKKIKVLFQNGNSQDKTLIGELSSEIIFLARLENVDWTESAPNPSATAIAGDLHIYIPLADLIDTGAEKERLKKEIIKIKAELEKTQIKLNNPSYVDKAPQAVVEKERERAAEWNSTLEKLEVQLQKLT
ncbi:MAG TPA: valine--tRNA ligase [Gammaproteobacteria bacterium]|nr:valine--tRNA ligase [Gammaproteobacteria bacterium]